MDKTDPKTKIAALKETLRLTKAELAARSRMVTKVSRRLMKLEEKAQAFAAAVDKELKRQAYNPRNYDSSVILRIALADFKKP